MASVTKAVVSWSVVLRRRVVVCPSVVVNVTSWVVVPSVTVVEMKYAEVEGVLVARNRRSIIQMGSIRNSYTICDETPGEFRFSQRPSNPSDQVPYPSSNQAESQRLDQIPALCSGILSHLKQWMEK